MRKDNYVSALNLLFVGMKEDEYINQKGLKILTDKVYEVLDYKHFEKFKEIFFKDNPQFEKEVLKKDFLYSNFIEQLYYCGNHQLKLEKIYSKIEIEKYLKLFKKFGMENKNES